jgi:hypothetical protein
MRKRLITLSSIMMLLFITSSCFDLSENIYSQVEVKNWFKSEKEIVMYAGGPIPCYNLFQRNKCFGHSWKMLLMNW